MGKARLYLGVAAASLVLSDHAAAFVQAEGTAVPSNNPEAIEEIIVTAQKRSQSIQDVGISISAFTNKDIARMGWANTENIAAQTPGLVATSFSGGSSTGLFSIRGISQNDFADHQEAPSAVYVDGVYMALTGSATSEMFDVERVEVLRGPQGTLFGRNATGGLVHITNRSPTYEFEGYTEITAAEYNQLRFEGALSGPLSDKVRARLSFASNNSDGYFRHSSAGLATIAGQVYGGFPEKAKATKADKFRGADNQNIRAQVDWDVTDNLVAGFTLNYGVVNNVGNAYDTVPTPDGVIDFTATDFFGSPFDPRVNSEAPNIRGFVDKKSVSYTGDLNYTGDGWGLTGIVNYSENRKSYLEDDDGGPYNIALFGTDQDASTFSAELRANGKTDRLTWTAGLYYLEIDGDYFGTFQFPGETGAPDVEPGTTIPGYGYGIDLDYGLSTKAFAAFAQGEFDFTDHLKLILGLRWTNDRKDFNIRATCVDIPVGLFTCVDVIPAGSLLAETSDTQLDLNDSFFTWKAQVEYKPMRDLMFYVGYNRGVKAGSFTAPLDGLLAPSQLTFKPETLDSFEGGMKADFMNGLMRLNMSGFYYDYKNYQGFVFNGISSIVTNFPATIYGGEVELTARPMTGLQARFGLSAMSARVKDVEVAPGVFSKQNMILAPDLAANWMLQYETDLGDGTVSLQYDGSYTGRQYYNTINGPLVSGKGYVLMNARVGYRFSVGDADTEVSLFVRNLANKKNLTYAFDLSAYFGNTIQVYGPPRIIGGTVRVNF